MVVGTGLVGPRKEPTMNIAFAHEPTTSARATRVIGVALAVLLAATALSLFNARPAAAATQRYWSGA